MANRNRNLGAQRSPSVVTQIKKRSSTVPTALRRGAIPSPSDSSEPNGRQIHESPAPSVDSLDVEARQKWDGDPEKLFDELRDRICNAMNGVIQVYQSARLASAGELLRKSVEVRRY